MAITTEQYNFSLNKLKVDYIEKKPWLAKLANSLLIEFDLVIQDTARQEELLGELHSVTQLFDDVLSSPEFISYKASNSPTDDPIILEARDILDAVPNNINQAKNSQGKSSIQAIIDAFG